MRTGVSERQVLWVKTCQRVKTNLHPFQLQRASSVPLRPQVPGYMCQHLQSLDQLI